MRKAEYFTKSKDNYVDCALCPNACRIAPGDRGRCLVRRNRDGLLIAENYARLAALSMDPIEKKPLFHYYPGSEILSAASWGCNLSCRWCQNWDLSQNERESREMTPGQLCDYVSASGRRMIAFTYSEPLMWYEYILDFARAIRSEDPDFRIVLVSNGYINPAPLARLIPLVSAVNIDIKAMDDKKYCEYTGGRLEPVLEAVSDIYSAGIHTELTYLVVPGVNDEEKMIRDFSLWVENTLSGDVPVHFSRYFPAYRSHTPPTTAEAMDRAYKIASEYLKYVYTGNMGGYGKEDTACPQCGNLLAKRERYVVSLPGIQGDKCSECGTTVDFVLGR